MDTDILRSELDRLRGQWTLISRTAGVSRKTLWRLMADAEYNPTIGTVKAISSAIDELRADHKVVA